MAQARAMNGNRPRGRSRRGFESLLGALVICLLVVAPAIAAQGPTKLEQPLVSPTSGTTATTISLEVTYRNHNNKAPDYVRVAVGGATHPMSPIGPLNWRDGVRFRWSGTLPVGAHAVRFEAADFEKFVDELAAGTVTITAPLPPPTPGPDPTPTPTPSPQPAPSAPPAPAPTPAPNPDPGTSGSPAPGSGSSSGSGGTGGGTTPAGGTSTTPGPSDGTTGDDDGRGGSWSAGAAGDGGGTAFGWTPPMSGTWNGPGGGGTSSHGGGGGDGVVGIGGLGTGSGTGGGSSGTDGIGGTGGAGDGGSGVMPPAGGSGHGAGLFTGVAAFLSSVGADPLTALLPGGGGTGLPLVASALGSTAAVGVWLAFSLFGKRRRDEQPPRPEGVLQAAAASGLGLVPSSGLVPEIQDPELLMPRWRRPSLLEARKQDPIREGLPERQSLSFGYDTVTSNERRLIRYATVRLLDRPDEVMGLAVADLAAGDEVELCDRSGLFWFVRAPDGRAGWLHRMTLGDQVSPGIRASA